MSGIDQWREPFTRAVSIYQNPGDFSVDNAILFTVIAAKLGLITEVEAHVIIVRYESPLAPYLKRHPTSEDLCSWDDHLAAAVHWQGYAQHLLQHMEFANWTLPNGNWIGRIPIFKPTIRAAAGNKIKLWDRIKVAAVYIANTFEKREETSGKQLLWLSAQVLVGQGWLCRTAVKYWRNRMMNKYPGGFRELCGIYYTNPDHPFRHAARVDFE